MSLINDALKRANQAHKDQGSQNAAGPAMQPTQTPQKSKMPVVITMVVSLVAIIGLSAWLFLSGNKPRAVTTQVPQTRAVANLTNGVTKKSAPITPTPAFQVVTQAVTVQLATHAVAQATNSIPTTRTPAPRAFSPSPVVASQPVQPVPSAPTVGPFPKLTLKGIIYNLTSPQVLINGSYLTLGEEIEGARIIKIERTRVTVKWNGQTKELAPE